jgi:hypothetical protein
MRCVLAVLQAILPVRGMILFRAFSGVTQFIIAITMASLGWTLGNIIARVFVFSLFDGWSAFLPEYTDSVTSDVLLSWFGWYGLDEIGKFLGMWFCFNHANFHMYNYIYLVRLKAQHRRKFHLALERFPELAEWPYTLRDAIYVVAYLVLDFVIPFIVMVISIYILSRIGGSVAFVPLIQWGGAIVLPFLAVSLYAYAQSIVRGAFHYARLEDEVGQNFDPSSW